MTTYVQAWDKTLVPVDEAPVGDRPVLVTAHLPEDVEVRQFEAQTVAVKVEANHSLVTAGVELGVSDVAEAPRFMPAFLVDGATCLLTTSLDKGRYVVYARYRGQVVRATPGILRVR